MRLPRDPLEDFDVPLLDPLERAQLRLGLARALLPILTDLTEPELDTVTGAVEAWLRAYGVALRIGEQDDTPP